MGLPTLPIPRMIRHSKPMLMLMEGLNTQGSSTQWAKLSLNPRLAICFSTFPSSLLSNITYLVLAAHIPANCAWLSALQILRIITAKIDTSALYLKRLLPYPPSNAPAADRKCIYAISAGWYFLERVKRGRQHWRRNSQSWPHLQTVGRRQLR